MRAAAAQLAAGVVVCALVQGYLERGVRVAKDVAAAPAVVASHKVVEVLFAGGVIADVGLVVGLFGVFVSFLGVFLFCLLSRVSREHARVMRPSDTIFRN